MSIGECKLPIQIYQLPKDLKKVYLPSQLLTYEKMFSLRLQPRSPGDRHE